MAECGSWPSIRARGLLSTAATLDLSGIDGERRRALEALRRPAKSLVELADGAQIVLRDQKPMSDARLANCLTDGIRPSQWYSFLNAKTFFWATPARLLTLLAAYSGDEHDVLQVDLNSLLGVHKNETWLCHMNSGNTTPWAHPRNFDVFRRIEDYPVTSTGRPVKEVAEIVVDYAVSDISRHVRLVQRMQGGEVTDPNPYGF
jgi:hypothetical protein